MFHSAEIMNRHRYAVILEAGEDGYLVAHVPPLPGVWSQGKTRAEVLVNIREAIELFIESARAKACVAPEDPL